MPTAPMPLLPNQIRLFENAAQRFRADVPPGITIEHVLAEPSYLTNIIDRLRIADSVQFYSETGKWVQEVLVARMDKERGLVWVMPTMPPCEFDINLARAPGLSGVIIEYVEGATKWRVRRDAKTIKDGFETKAEAKKWATGHAG